MSLCLDSQATQLPKSVSYFLPNPNPTVGLILCTEKNEAVAKYSVLSERKRIFASKYMLYLPS